MDKFYAERNKEWGALQADPKTTNADREAFGRKWGLLAQEYNQRVQEANRADDPALRSLNRLIDAGHRDTGRARTTGELQAAHDELARRKESRDNYLSHRNNHIGEAVLEGDRKRQEREALERQAPKPTLMDKVKGLFGKDGKGEDSDREGRLAKFRAQLRQQDKDRDRGIDR